MPSLSAHFASRQPSSIRVAQIRFDERNDDTRAVNVAIGNVSLPMHPALQARMRALGEPGSPFEHGVVKYTTTDGTADARRAFLHVIASSGFPTDGLHCLTTDGGSQAMELLVVGMCGAAGTADRPLLLIDAAYTNYQAFAQRCGRATVNITRTLSDEGRFSLPDFAEIEAVIERTKPGALVVIPYDNPTGQFYARESLVELARLCVKHDLWMISDEAYRELFYTGGHATSVWGIGEDDAPGITGRRVSIETASKVWNACGLRMGAIVTDNADLCRTTIAEKTASLCSSAIGQWIFAALGEVPHEDLQKWYAAQREYYGGMLSSFTDTMKALLPGAIVSSPDAALYSVIDVRDVAAPGFDALEFVLWCATEGSIDLDGAPHTLLTAPMGGFYTVKKGEPNPGRTQMRVAYVESPEVMARVPALFAELFRKYEAAR